MQLIHRNRGCQSPEGGHWFWLAGYLYFFGQLRVMIRDSNITICCVIGKIPDMYIGDKYIDGCD